MPIISSGSRHQMKMLCWEQCIGSENPVRVVDAFVEYLDLEALGFIHKGQSHEGRPAYSCSILVKLYLYGYLNRIRSSRQLAQAAGVNIELYWLLEERKPKYKTIADFRKDNGLALEALFNQFGVFMKGEGLLESDTAAIDGSKFGAQNSKKNNYNVKKVNQLLKGREKVSGEFHLIFTCYNLRRCMTIWGVKGLIERLRAAFLAFLALWRTVGTGVKCMIRAPQESSQQQQLAWLGFMDF